MTPTRGTRWRDVILGIALCAVVLAWRMTIVRPDIRLWTAIVWVSLCAAGWGLSDARWSSRVVRRAIVDHPDGDYSTAIVSAKNHLVAHWTLFLVQVYWFAHAIFTGRQPGIPRIGPITPSEVASIVVLLASEITLMALNFWLLFGRRKLRRNVLRIGGD